METPSGVGNGDGVSPPQPTRGSGERRELHQRGTGRRPGRQRIFGIFKVHRTLLVERTLLLYCMMNKAPKRHIDDMK